MNKVAELFHDVKGHPEHYSVVWEAFVKTASADPDGTSVGLMKLALDVWAVAQARGLRPTMLKEAREATAASFASSYTAAVAAEKLAEFGEITPQECEIVKYHIAQSAVRELATLAKCADAFGGMPQGDPSMMQGMPQGAPQQGAPQQGAPQGDPQQEGPEAIGEQGDAQAGMVEDLNRAQDTINNLLFMAQQVQRPALAAQIQEQSEALMDHFARGNNYLPPEFQHHFSKSEHAEEFMKKYKQRFGAIGGKGSTK